MKNVVGYKNPVRTSQETLRISATEHNQLMLHKIWSFTMATMKNAVFWDVAPFGACKKPRFGGKYRLHHQGNKNVHYVACMFSISSQRESVASYD
jgi:hypothetical protein